jgi:hypothetical protein
MMSRLEDLALALNPKQAATVAFVSVFVTIIGGFLLALWFARRNRKFG